MRYTTLLFAALVLPVSPLGAQTTFTVNSTDDLDDGTCDTSHCSLREALNAANANPGADIIDFNISGVGPHTIQPVSALPSITDPVVIDGTSEPDFAGTPMVELDGTNAGSAHGLHLTGGTSTIRGLVINRFQLNGIDIGAFTTNNVIEGNYIGTDVTGTSALGNDGNGINIAESSGNMVGGLTAAARNVISGNNTHGIEIAAGATGNTVLGNYVGTDAAGTSALGNAEVGVAIIDAPNNTVGGTAGGARNVISGNTQSGVRIVEAGSTGNVVLGNYIGTDVTGTADLGNVDRGVEIVRASGNTVGGTSAAARNIISGNDKSGVYITLAGGSGPASDNLIYGNYIGTDPTGTVAVGNRIGVFIFGQFAGVTGNAVGGAASGAGNLISGNNSTGLLIAGPGATSNLVEGNLIGTDVTGTVALGNGGSGANIQADATSNRVGGTSAGSGNVISGNANGVTIASNNNTVEGNYIGIDAAGTADLGNSEHGVRILATAGLPVATGNTVGGTTPEARNVISGNGMNGVYIALTGGTTISDNVIQGNYIGTDATGTMAIPNDEHGVLIELAPDNTVGGTVAGAGNVISANTNGVTITGAGATGNLVQGNTIGSDVSGTGNLGNTGHGVYVTASASKNTVGGSAAGAGNQISFNGGDGVFVESGTGNAVRANSIFDNVGQGIDLGLDGISANDAGDGDIGANDLQNFPVSLSATSGSVTIRGSLNSTASTTFTLEFFTSTGCDVSGHGEGGQFLGSTTVTTGAGDDGDFITTFAATPATGSVVTATATDPNNNTSEFSACATVSDFLTLTVNTTDDMDDGACGVTHCSLREAINGANTAVGTDVIAFNIAGAGPHTILPGSALPQITDPVIIDGTTEPDFAGTPVIELDGSNSSGATGLIITAGNSTVRGLVINRFFDGIVLQTKGGNVIEGNYIGTDVSGAAVMSNTGVAGIHVNNVPDNTIGGTVPEARNVISGNGDGVFISGSSASGNVVQGNYIGTNAAGTVALGNRGQGVFVGGAPDNTVGGTVAGARNVISGNTEAGVFINAAGATGNLIQGNYIGTDAGGAAPLGNGIGVSVSHSGNTIGGTTVEARNVISGNGVGVAIGGSGATGNLVQGNYIGTDAAGASDVGNGQHGVHIHTDASDNSIGGTAGGAANIIAFNGGDGVFVESGTGNAILSNSVYSNAGLGIDLAPDAVTANDAADGDVGANNLQNFPVVSSVLAGSATIDGTLNSTPSTEFRLEFFSATACDASNHGEGELFVDRTTVTTDGNGDASFSLATAATVPDGHGYVTATATDPGDNTSEFSECASIMTDFTVAASPDVVTVAAGQSAEYMVTIHPVARSLDDPVTFACSDLPSLTSCTFSPSSVTPGADDATSTLTVSTTAAVSSVVPNLRRIPPAPAAPDASLPTLPLGVLLSALAGILLWAAGVGRRSLERKVGLPAALIVALSMVFYGGCGGDKPVGPGDGNGTPGTPTGSFTFTITGTAGSLEHATTATLIVQ